MVKCGLAADVEANYFCQIKRNSRLFEGELTVYPDAQFMTVLFELPGIKTISSLMAHIDADVSNQILRMLWHPTRGEIIRRSYGH